MERVLCKQGSGVTQIAPSTNFHETNVTKRGEKVAYFAGSRSRWIARRHGAQFSRSKTESVKNSSVNNESERGIATDLTAPDIDVTVKHFLPEQHYKVVIFLLVTTSTQNVTSHCRSWFVINGKAKSSKGWYVRRKQQRKPCLHVS